MLCALHDTRLVYTNTGSRIVCRGFNLFLPPPLFSNSTYSYPSHSSLIQIIPSPLSPTLLSFNVFTDPLSFIQRIHCPLLLSFNVFTAPPFFNSAHSLPPLLPSFNAFTASPSLFSFNLFTVYLLPSLLILLILLYEIRKFQLLNRMREIFLFTLK